MDDDWGYPYDSGKHHIFLVLQQIDQTMSDSGILPKNMFFPQRDIYCLGTAIWKNVFFAETYDHRFTHQGVPQGWIRSTCWGTYQYLNRLHNYGKQSCFIDRSSQIIYT